MNNATSTFLGQGVLGATVVVLAMVVIRLYNKIDQIQKEKDDLLELRRQDAVQTTQQLATVLQANTDSIRSISDKIELARNRRR